MNRTKLGWDTMSQREEGFERYVSNNKKLGITIFKQGKYGKIDRK